MASRSQGHVESGLPCDPISAAGATVCGVLESGVRTAYAVIDEYMWRGQNAARATYNDFYKRGPMNEDRPNFGAYNNPWSGGYNNPGNPISMMLEQWIMAMRMWSQAVSSVMPGGFPQPGMYPAAFNEPAMPSVTIKVSCASSVEVELNLYPGLDQARLVCEELRAEDFSGARFSEPVSLVREGGVVRATVKVGGAQPKGRYRALVRRETDRSVVGELVVTVL